MVVVYHGVVQIVVVVGLCRNLIVGCVLNRVATEKLVLIATIPAIATTPVVVPPVHSLALFVGGVAAVIMSLTMPIEGIVVIVLAALVLLRVILTAVVVVVVSVVVIFTGEALVRVRIVVVLVGVVVAPVAKAILRLLGVSEALRVIVVV